MNPVPVLPDDALAVILRNTIGQAAGEFERVEDLHTAANRLEALERVDEILTTGRALIADARASVIAEAAAATSARQAAADLGLSVAAVSKACARAKAHSST